MQLRHLVLQHLRPLLKPASARNSGSDGCNSDSNGCSSSGNGCNSNSNRDNNNIDVVMGLA